MASVSKRKWTYKGQVKTAWIARYVDGGGQRRQETFEKKKDADAFLEKTKTDLKADSHVARPDKMTVAELCELFLRHSEDKVRDGRLGRTSYENRAGYLAKSILPTIGQMMFAVPAPDSETPSLVLSGDCRG